MSVQYPLTIFYDASCPLCRREIDLLAKFDTQHLLAMQDCSDPLYPGADGHTRQAMMELIHARDATGQWLIGAPVFAAAYQATGFASIARLWGNARLQPMWAVVYPWIARNRNTLSRLGVVSVFTWTLNRLHARAAKRSVEAMANAPCAEDACSMKKEP
jgi:predicted DCC family thiol-disulfide oxidoreductase YuxK